MNIFYGKKFYNNQKNGSNESASIIVPLIVQHFKPKSVVDVGCGIGTWVSEFIKNGTEDVVGIDGDYVENEMLLFPSEKFKAFDLKKTLKLNRKFDLAISLEVAEHIPEKYSDIFVENLANLAPVILFSSAIPFQGGTNHVNEQWQEYWANKFLSKNYIPSTALRDKIWNIEEVEVWYRQNMILYVSKDYLASNPEVNELFVGCSKLSVVHPQMYLINSDSKNYPLDRMIRNIINFPFAFVNMCVRYIKRKFK